MKINDDIINQLLLNNLNEFLEDINKVYKLDNKYLTKFIFPLNDTSTNYLNDIKKNFKIQYNDIFKNNSIDDINKLFNENNILLIDNISLSDIWNTITNNNDKKTIIQYINVFYTIFTLKQSDNSNNSNNLDFFLNQFQKIFDDQNNNNNQNIQSTLNNIDKEQVQDLCKNIEQQINDNSDNTIFKLAQEMSSELMTENINFDDLLNGNNNKDLMNVISNIGNKLQSKFQSDDIKQEDLINDMNKFINTNDGLFKNLFNNFNDNINNQKINQKKIKKDKKDKKKKRK